MARWTKLALKGGGAKGYVYIGIAQALEEKGILKDIDVIAGTSVGAIGCLLLSTGLSVKELKQKVYNTDFERMIYNSSVFKEAYNLYYYQGIHQGSELHHWFGEIIESVTGDKNTTFAQWHQLKKKHPEKNLKDMVIEACNATKTMNDVFSATSPLKDTPICDALRASMAIPIFFTPWKIGEYKYIDGGTQANCPIAVFNQNNAIDKKALGIWLAPKDVIEHEETGKPLPNHDVNSLIHILEATLEASLNTQLFELEHSPYKEQLIFCDTLDVGTLQFSMPEEKKQALIESGYNSVLHFLQIQEKREFSKLSRILEGLDLSADYKNITPSFNHKKRRLTAPQLDSANQDTVEKVQLKA